MASFSIITCINSVFIFILLAAPGYAARRFKLLQSEHIDGLSVLLVNFLWPAMVIDAMSSVVINKQLLHMTIYTGSISFLFYVLSIIFSLLYIKIRKTPKALYPVFIFAISFNNTGLIGMPFIKEVLGNEALFIASIIELINDIFIFTIGIMLFHSSKFNLKTSLKAMLSPGFISVIVGFIIFLFHINIPDVISKPIAYMSAATTAVAMFLVGAQLGEASIKELWKDKKAYEISLLRLLGIPLILFIILFLILQNHSLADSVLVIMAAMPTAACTTIFARQFKKDYHLSTNCVMMSTFCSILALPIWLILTSAFQ